MDYQYQVTVGIPVFNVEKYVEKALISALEQDFVLPYEILVVDDCGTDSSMDIVRHIVKTHRNGDRIRIVTHDKNRGLGEARNTIIHNSQGRFLIFVDSDDWMEGNALSVLYKRAIETGAEITVGGSWYFRDDGNRAEYRMYPDVFVSHQAAGVYLLSTMHIAIRGELWAKLWSMEFVKSHSLECFLRVVEDFIPEFRALVESSSICLVSDPVYNYYFMRNDSIMSSQQTQRIKERSIAWTNNINTIRALVADKYSDIPGIFDLYLTKLRHCYRNIITVPIDDELAGFINEQIRGCISIIPSAKLIQNRNNKLMYFFLRKDDSLESYARYERLLTRTSHVFAKLKRVFHA